jgi:hypothetical protein
MPSPKVLSIDRHVHGCADEIQGEEDGRRRYVDVLGWCTAQGPCVWQIWRSILHLESYQIGRTVAQRRFHTMAAIVFGSLCDVVSVVEHHTSL